MFIWIHGLQPPTVNGSLCTDLGRLWTAVCREDWLCLQSTEQAAPLFCYWELNSHSRSPQVLVPLQVGSRFHMYILTSLCNPCLVVMLCKQPSLPEQWFPRALRAFAGEAFPPNKQYCMSWQMTLVKELWICVGLFLFATSAAWTILGKVNWPLSSPGCWKDGIHKECTSSRQHSSMSVLTSDPISTNSVRQRRYFFPRGEQLPSGEPDNV